MSKLLTTDTSMGFGYETPATTVETLISEGVLCESSKLDIEDWTELPDAL